MTANATADDRARCEEAGMNDHIAKPVIPNVLFETLMKWVEHKDRDLSDFPETGMEESTTEEALPNSGTQKSKPKRKKRGHRGHRRKKSGGSSSGGRKKAKAPLKRSTR